MKNEDIISGSILKLLRHRQFINKEKTPISAQFILTNRCNLSCVFCCNKKRWGPQEMAKEQAFKILKDLKDLGVMGIEFTGGSEPLMHPDFEEILEYCIGLGLTPALVTNGVRLCNISKSLLGKLDWIRISINASRDLYKEIHGIDAYDRVMEGLEWIQDMDVPNKGVSYIFCHLSTLDDSQKLVDDLQKFSLNYFRFSIDIFNDLRFNVGPNHLKSDNFIVVSHSERPKYIPKTCNIFYYKPVIDCSGIVYPCCTNMHREVLPLGKAENIKQLMGDKNIKLDTNKCKYCIYGAANDLIEQMNIDIKNENFI